MNDTAPSAAQLLQQAQLTEVDFGKLSRRAFDPPDRADVLAETTVLAREPVQRGIRYG